MDGISNKRKTFKTAISSLSLKINTKLLTVQIYTQLLRKFWAQNESFWGFAHSRHKKSFYYLGNKLFEFPSALVLCRAMKREAARLY